MGALQTLRPWGFVFVMGALFGFVVGAVGGGLLEERSPFSHESAAARQYMISLLEQEPQSLIALTPRSDVVSRAMQFASAEGTAGTITPLSLTYLGGKSSGLLSVHAYAIEVRSADGQRQFFPLALTLVGGKVVRRE